MSAESENEKQRALLQQKIEFLQTSMEEANKREKELSLELKNQKRETLNSTKESQQKYDQQLREF